MTNKKWINFGEVTFKKGDYFEVKSKSVADGYVVNNAIIEIIDTDKKYIIDVIISQREEERLLSNGIDLNDIWEFAPPLDQLSSFFDIDYFVFRKINTSELAIIRLMDL